ncbi:UNVERIFIED_ORG: hypothetical protein LHK14_17660 [Roseateles sp. XES5]|nr:ClpX C4-type zinc finger protein [Roseateles sp. XES5]
MAEISSPTDVFPEITCSFCGLSAKECRVLLRSETSIAFICDACAPAAAAQIRDILKRRESGH